MLLGRLLVRAAAGALLAVLVVDDDGVRVHVHRLAAARRREDVAVRVRVVVEGVVRAEVDADVVVRELAHLGIVDTEDLGLFVAAHAHAGDEVEEPEDDGGHDEGVGHARDRVCDLVAELDVVVVEPAAGNGRAAVEARDAGLGEEACEDVADESADGVRGEDLRHRV